MCSLRERSVFGSCRVIPPHFSVHFVARHSSLIIPRVDWSYLTNLTPRCSAESIPRACISSKAVCTETETLPRTVFAGSITSLTGRASRFASPAGGGIAIASQLRLGFVIDVFIFYLLELVKAISMHRARRVMQSRDESERGEARLFRL